MLSRKLIVSLGLEVSKKPCVLSKQKRKRKLCIHDSFKPPSITTNGDVTVNESHTSCESDSSLSQVYSENTDDNFDEDLEAWSKEYALANQNQTNETIQNINEQIKKLTNKTYDQDFVSQLEKQDDERLIEELESQKKGLHASMQLSNRTETSVHHVDHEECSYCGMIGTIQINVHRCVKHCMSCHRETPVEHFFETTGTNLMVTNPGRYTRRGHFMSTLKRIQGKRPVNLPPTLLGEVKTHFATYYNAHCPKDIETKYKLMKPVLKALGYNDKKKKGDYTDHIMIIFCQLIGRDPPRFAIVEEQKLIRDFDDLDTVFEQACVELDEKRNNWLSYELTIYSLCLKNGYDNMKEWLGILKGYVTLRKQQSIMKRMFELLNWTYIPLDLEETNSESTCSFDPKKPNQKLPIPQPTILDMFTFLQNANTVKKITSTKNASFEEHMMSTDDESPTKHTSSKKKRKLPKGRKNINKKKNKGK